MNNGFIIVASVNKKFLISAKYCAETLKEYFPTCNVTLFTQTEWITKDLYDVFDSVVGGAPNHQRAKLWALSKTPYDLTAYLDADCEIQSKEIKNIFNQIDDETDILLTKIRPYHGKIVYFQGGKLTDHCGVFLYRKNGRTIKFMEEWWNLYQKQFSGEWEWDTNLYPEELRKWDQWTYWWLQNKTDYKITRKYFKDDARWNFVNGYKKTETDKEIIIYHHTVSK